MDNIYYSPFVRQVLFIGYASRSAISRSKYSVECVREDELLQKNLCVRT